MLLETRDLTKRYGDFTALDALTFDVKPGEVVGLLGPNGSGKTTALRLIMGFLRPTSGSAAVAGHDSWADGVEARKSVAYLPAELRLYENMTGRQLIRFLCDLRGAGIDEDIYPLAKAFDIDIDRPIANMSSGMKRKVAILQVLAPRTPLVIMDEPTNALDPNMRDELVAQIGKARARGQAVLFSSHILHEVEQVCDRVIVLRRGKLVHAQTMAELQAGRLIHVRFESRPIAAPSPTGIYSPDASAGLPLPNLIMPPQLEGLHIREQASDRLTIEYTGPLSPVLDWLSGQAVRELRVEPLGLNAIYYRFHGNPDE